MVLNHILLSPDSFKGTLTASEAARAMERGVRRVLGERVHVVRCPLSDGGAGLIDALRDALAGEVRQTMVTGPIPSQRVNAAWFLAADRKIAVIEMAQAAGLLLVPPAKRDPKATTTRGVGELIRAAFDAGVKTVIVGLGGSGTNDGGAGMLEALGARLIGNDGAPLRPGGGALRELAKIDATRVDPRLRSVPVIAACDVRNPLVGPEGASQVYARQKGASPEDVALLDEALRRFGDVVRTTTGIEVNTLPGAGAAGGTAATLAAFAGARIRSGIDVVLNAIGFDEQLADTDLVITGEGRFDAQTSFGKTIMGVLEHSKQHNVPVAAVAGMVEGTPGAVMQKTGLIDLISLAGAGTSPGEAMAHAAALLEERTATLLQRLLQ